VQILFVLLNDGDPAVAQEGDELSRIGTAVPSTLLSSLTW